MAETHVDPAATEVDPTFLESFSERFGAAWDLNQPERLVELMTEDIVYDDSAWTRTMAATATCASSSSSSGARCRISSSRTRGTVSISGGAHGCVLLEGHGPFTGPLDPPGFAPPASGSRSKGLTS